MKSRIIHAVVLVTALATTGALAQPAPVAVQGAWTRPTPPGAATGVIYLTMTAVADDRLTGASSPVATKTEVHESRMDGNVMRMRPVAGGLELPAGKPVLLQPGGYHLMMEGLKAPLRQGQTIAVHLTFQKAPPLDITVPVQPVGTSGPPGGMAPMDHSAMPGMEMGK
jgi:copper(I)-binding protein